MIDVFLQEKVSPFAVTARSRQALAGSLPFKYLYFSTPDNARLCYRGSALPCVCPVKVKASRPQVSSPGWPLRSMDKNWSGRELHGKVKACPLQQVTVCLQGEGSAHPLPDGDRLVGTLMM